MDKRPIGIFDSGVGGLTVVDKFFRLLPNERIVYLGDTARVPYGNKSKETVTRFSKEIIAFLLRFKVKLIVVACNTVSSLCLPALQKSCPVPVLGVIKPGVLEAVRASRTRRIGVIGTQATILSGVYKNEIKAVSKKAFVAQKACPLFVPLVENMWLNGEITLKIARQYLSPILAERIDSLVLGCTHYPLLKNVIRKIVGKNVTLVDSSEAVTKYAGLLLANRKLLAGAGSASARFFATDAQASFAELARVFLGKKIKAKKVIL
ncbi:MAG: glutamate racemase [Omnitrophica bacterium]|nr:glutamate racemase [Candidatus Omnitrophota bacterium]